MFTRWNTSLCSGNGYCSHFQGRDLKYGEDHFEKFSFMVEIYFTKTVEMSVQRVEKTLVDIME